MGILYIALAIDKDVSAWLEAEGLSLPKNSLSRFPTLEEIKKVLSTYKGFSIQYSEENIGSFWQAAIINSDQNGHENWTTLNIDKLTEGYNPFSFEKGTPELVLNIISKLTKYTGPLVMVTDSGDEPIVITGSISDADVIDSWLKKI